jgi:hypothetical protein
VIVSQIKGVEEMKKEEKRTTGVESGNHLSVLEYSEHVVLGAKQGHGFAAEKVNNLLDKLRGKDARIVGGNNARNGPDRLFEGTFLQSKYCQNAKLSVSACFEKGNGSFKYVNSDKSCMVVEVPLDQYQDAVKAMQIKILEGRVPGVKNPEDASKLIRKGSITYTQARNIAKAGTIESLSYDAATGAISATAAFSISALVTFARAIWSGEDPQLAIKEACKTGLYIGGTTVLAHIASQQLIKLGTDKAIQGIGQSIVNKIGSKSSTLIAKSAGYNVTGNAAKNVASKIIRGNIVVGAVTIAVLSSADVIRMFQRKISGKQLFKNVTKTTAGVVGGGAGFFGGAILGAKLGNKLGRLGGLIGAILGGIGGIIGSTGASIGASKVLDHFIEDDADQMLKILQERLAKYANEYLLTEAEVNQILDHMNSYQENLVNLLQKMFQSSDREHVADQYLMPLIEAAMNQRLVISNSSSKSFVWVKNKIIKGIKSLCFKISSSRFYLREGSVKRFLLEPFTIKASKLRYYYASPKMNEYNKIIEGVFVEIIEENK